MEITGWVQEHFQKSVCELSSLCRTQTQVKARSCVEEQTWSSNITEAHLKRPEEKWKDVPWSRKSKSSRPKRRTLSSEDNIPTSPAAAPDVYELLLKEERMLHSGKHVAGITFRFTLLFFEIYKSSLVFNFTLNRVQKVSFTLYPQI